MNTKIKEKLLEETLNNLISIKNNIDALKIKESDFKTILIGIMDSYDQKKIIKKNYVINVLGGNQVKRLNTTIYHKKIQELLKYTDDQMNKLKNSASSTTTIKKFIKITKLKKKQNDS